MLTFRTIDLRPDRRRLYRTDRGGQESGPVAVKRSSSCAEHQQRAMEGHRNPIQICHGFASLSQGDQA